MIKPRFLLFSVLAPLFGAISNWDIPAHSALTIIQCSGKIPNNTACLINASSFKIDIYRIDICEKNPFPDYRMTPDYSGAGCISLFNQKGKSWEVDSKNKIKIPNLDREKIKSGSFKYSAIILKNSFTSSGKYTSGERTWTTGGVDARTNKKILKIGEVNPVEFTTKLTNWRGKNNKNNDYCINNGGTYSRCEVKYNGYEVTSVGMGADLIESYGSSLKYMFYMNKLLSPINLKQESAGDFYLEIKNRLEVYGNGRTVTSISIAPFIFDVAYDGNKLN